MNRNLLLLLVIILGLANTGAGEMTKNDSIKMKAIDEMLKKHPHFTDILSFEESPIKGLYEVVMGDNIIYWSNDGYMIFGEMFSKEGKSISRDKRQKILNMKLSRVPLEKAIKIGSGKNIVVEFVDPDCPFCRTLNDFFEKRNDVTRYVYLFPLTQLHKDSANKVAYILSAKDRVLAHNEVFAGKHDNPKLPKQSEESNKLVNDCLDLARTVGVSGTPVLWVNGTYVNGADMQRIAALLKGEGEVKKL